MQNHVSIIKYWSATELFEPQRIPKLAQNDKNEPVITAYSNDYLPWKAEDQIRMAQSPPKGREVIRHQVYCGVFSLRKLKELFLEVFKVEDEPNFDGRDDGESAVFTFTVNEKGQPLVETFTISSCAWALGQTSQTRHQSREWLEGFERAATESANKFAERMAKLARTQAGKSTDETIINNGTNDNVSAITDSVRMSDENGEVVNLPVLSFNDLLSETQIICKQLGVERLVEAGEIRIKSQMIYLADNAPEQNNFLNSFFLRDLRLVAGQVEKRNYGVALQQFLMSDADVKQINRTDLRQAVGTLFTQMSPALFPSGRWAGAVNQPLVFSQQIAVNLMWQKLADNAGLFSVNGPPGTGKTTLLRDLIAAVIVRRAETLASFKNPKQAFYGAKIHWKSLKDYDHKISPLKAKLKDFGIVVASSNNGAVENITLELPDKKAVADTWHKECDYFAEVATNLLKEREDTSNVKTQSAWGLIAARLGNTKNKTDFVKKFWFDGENGFKSVLNAALKTQTDSTNDIWQKAVAEFRAAVAEEQQLRTGKLRIYEQHLELAKIVNELNELPKQKELVRAKLPEIEAHLKEIENEKQNLKSRQRKLETQRKCHTAARPNWLSNVFSLWRKHRQWQSESERLEKELSAVRNNLIQSENEERLIELRKQNVIEQVNTFESRACDLATRKELISLVLQQAKSDLKENYPDVSKWQQKDCEESRERSSPWSDENWAAARTKVFLKALQLHKAFITVNAEVIKRNLDAFIDLLKGTILPESISSGAADVWSTFFLVVPVVSTTFASFDKLFAHLNREEIGWLLIDEAGQAVPQAAVGALWRSRRSVVVGDPLQLEPISILPGKMQKALSLKFGVEDTWIPGGTSVQELADRVNSFGTLMKVQNDSIWVGSPLRVHRRCQEPMFSIANKIAYDGLMVFGTRIEDKLRLEESRWYNVESSEAQGHWIPGEGNIAENILQILDGQVKPEDIYLISPFSQVANELQRLGRRYKVKNSGTVHKTQGKEADVVILVLGGDPAKPGAKTWAASKPNLLNVAVSRAKRRLYVIGNKELWGKQPYFKTALEEIEKYSG